MISIDRFAENVFGSSRYNQTFIDSTLALLNYQIDMKHACEGAGELLLETMLQVGLNPSTEQARRDQDQRLLSNTMSDQADVQSAVEYILSQMIVKPMGQAAECFAIKPCRSHINSVFPAWDIGIHRDVQCHKIIQNSAFSTNWQQAADMLFFARAPANWPGPVNNLSSRRMPEEDDLVIVGIRRGQVPRKTSKTEVTQSDGAPPASHSWRRCSACAVWPNRACL